MRHIPFIADTEIMAPEPSLVSRRPRKNIFKAIMEALHYSRRLQAERFLRQHRDLIDTAQHSIRRELRGREDAE